MAIPEIERLEVVLRDMREVTKREFFDTIGKLDVHPRSEREASYWETPARQLRGVTEPGYMCRDREGNYTTIKRYWAR